MIPFVQQALALGYSAANILQFIQGHIPNLKQGIQGAKKQGYADEAILQFLSNKVRPKGREATNLTPGERYLKESGLKTRKEKEETTAKYLSGALNIGAGALSAYRLYQQLQPVVSGIGQALNIAKPSAPQSMSPGLPQPQMGQAPAQAQSMTQAPSPVPGIQQPLQAQKLGEAPSAVSSSNLQKGVDILRSNSSYKGLIDNMLSNEAPIEDISGVMRKLYKNHIPSIEKESGSDIENILKQYVSDSKIQKPETEKSVESPLQKQTEDLQSEDLKTPEMQAQPEVKPFQLAFTPKGEVATIKEIKGKVAKVEIDGKEHLKKVEDLDIAPVNDRELADIYEELISKIPEKDRSAVINIAGYDPDNNSLSVVFHSGDTYTYEDIPPEFAERLKGALFTAKTTGNNMLGAWAEGEASRGAGLFQLIKELQEYYGGKGKEYSRKFKKLYHFHEPAIEALKKKNKEKKAYEKAARKKRKGVD